MHTSFSPSWLAGTLLPLGVVWSLWRLALRREQCFGYNRALLLLAPVVAAVWPLLPRPALPGFWASTAALSPAAPVLLPVLRINAVGAALGWPGWWWLAVLYAAGVALGLGRLAYRYAQLRRSTHHLPREQRAGYALAYTSGQLPTSSFGHTVFWDETTGLTPAEAASVLAHELAHVRQGHSYDVLWLEIWRVVLWPNPFAHLLLPALRLTHELLADRAAAATPADAPIAYPALLARLATRQLVGASYLPILQPFTFSFTLTRIAMLQSKNPVRRWKQWLVLPTLGGLFLAACQASPSLEEAIPPPPPPVLTTVPEAVFDSTRHVYTFVEEMPQLPGNKGQEAIVQAICSKLVYPKLAPNAQQEGRVFVNFTVGADGGVRDVTLIKGMAPAYNEAVLAAVRQLPTFVPGKQRGKAVNVSFTVPVLFKKS